MKRRSFLRHAAAALTPAARGAAAAPPNIVLILVDDLGYGDLSCYGSQIATPNIDRMAQEGVLFTQFYAANPVCSPSRASFLTGRYGVRAGVPYVLQPTDTGGMAQSEVTIPQMLKPLGYQSMCVGKWHLGRPDAYLPTARGFDEYWGIPYSNDMSPSILMHNTTVIESPVNQSTLTARYTSQAIDFIKRSANGPFFLYLPHTFPHIPLAASPAFAGKSGMGLYGDVVQELDWSVGQVLNALQANGVDDRTLVMFTSDNGPWFQGSPGRLRGRKGDTFEGGMREPFIARFPGAIPAAAGNRSEHRIRTVNSLASALDVLPTIAALTGARLPANPLDGVDITPVLNGQATAVDHPLFLYFSGWYLQCARSGPWKLHMARYNTPAYAPEPKVGYYNLRLLNPELYNIDTDPEEGEDVAADHPDIVKSIQAAVNKALPGLPQQVQSAWEDTQSRPVNPNQSGNWPTPILP